MPDQIQTVEGPVSPDALGVTLIHEHVMVDFIGAAHVSPERYDADEVFRVALPFLEQFRALGGCSLVECTPAYIGRDPGLLRRLAEASGVRLITNTGYYGAANDKYLPAHAFTETAEQLADRWLRECERGIDGTGIFPGFIKIGVDTGPLSEVDAKLVRAAARVHQRTGLTIASHTGPGVPAMAQIDLLEELGVSPRRVDLGACAGRARTPRSTSRRPAAAPGWNSTASRRTRSSATWARRRHEGGRFAGSRADLA